jgi:hypothetical protein
LDFLPYLAQLPPLDFCQVNTVEKHIPFCGVVKADNCAAGGRLAAAALAYQAKRLTGIDFKTDIIYRFDFTYLAPEDTSVDWKILFQVLDT